MVSYLPYTVQLTTTTSASIDDDGTTLQRHVSIYLIMFLKLQIIILFTSLCMFQDYLCQIDDTDIATDTDTTVWHYEVNRKLAEYYRRASMGDGYCAREPGSLIYCVSDIPHKLIGAPSYNRSKSLYNECGRLDVDAPLTCEPYKCVYDNIGTSESPGSFMHEMYEYIRENPDMEDAANIATSNCIDVEVQQQGVMRDCPAYDIHVCIMKELTQNMPLSLWDPGCMQEREYYIRCHVCPIDCRAQSHMEFGTCFACADI